MSVPDLGPTAQEVVRVLAGVRDDHLGAPTPCPGHTVASLVAHLDGLAEAFTAAARKDLGPLTDTDPGDAPPDLRPGWRERVPARLLALAEAWRDPAAWDGETRAGGVDLPGEVAGAVALDEVLIHGWDVAVATGQRVTYDEAALTACLGVVGAPRDPASDDGTLFGPPVPVPHGAPLLDRVLGLAGRDPGWSPPG